MERFALVALAISLAANALSALTAYPHQLAYFNELSGGRENGHAHLLHSSADWGQDLISIRAWMSKNSVSDSEVYVGPGGSRHIEGLRPGGDKISNHDISWVILPSTSVFRSESPWSARVLDEGTVRIGSATFAFPRVPESGEAATDPVSASRSSAGQTPESAQGIL